MSQEERYKYLKDQHIKLNNQNYPSFILDIGGGGEAIISKLYKNKVVSIDMIEEELKEAESESLKIVMNATDLKFLDDSFEVVTYFYSLMYMDMKTKYDALKESIRVLKKDGLIEIWDTEIPPYDGGDKDIIVVKLKIKLDDEMVETGYGVRSEEKKQSFSDIVKILSDLGLEKISSEQNGQAFHLIFQKTMSWNY